MSLFHKKTSDNKGFTMIEVIAVLIILGIIAAVAISSVGSNQSDLIPQADIVKTHLRFAQLKALSDDSSSSWGIAFSGNLYTLKNGTADASINLPGENGNSHPFPSGFTIGGDAAVNFDSWGSPIGGIKAVTLTQGSQTTTINVAANTGFITP